MASFFYQLRFKKPHKWFFKDDIVYGEIWDGQAVRMVCYGWSRKLNKFVARYRLQYQGWKRNISDTTPDGRGYLKIENVIKVEYALKRNYGDHPILWILNGYNFTGPLRSIRNEGDSWRLFNELLSAGKVEPYRD